jgi:hypothetical protein
MDIDLEKEGRRFESNPVGALTAELVLESSEPPPFRQILSPAAKTLARQ